MPHIWVVILSFSILPAAVICAARYNTMLRTYYPFAYLTWLSLVNEVISVFSTAYSGSNAVNNNLYILAEWLLVVWLMHNWFMKRKRKIFYIITGALLALVWLADTFFIGSIHRFNSIFRICYSLAIAFMAIDQFNALIVMGRHRLATNARFLICCGLIFYFVYKAILEVLFMLDLSDSAHFQRIIFQAMAYINVICNLIYTIASLCIPTKQRFTLPYL
ncbi:hypothetical protein [Sediminibacterium ginsengisoli]|uniref:YhhN-like protein n=1 Tax=Sediminibacterium ginsengisoli TaxID=413434 RepID=A0A1T4MMF7_9BACT|nr:hypothetical protein [Sediminibacterium ginsengisoli]SJZ67888.1 hypothetical protein SAMN04488132_103447 [Sediminibacterium ginsengisoli]